MFEANITRAAAAVRATKISDVNYQVHLDVTPQAAKAAGMNPSEHFWSQTTIDFNFSGGECFVNLIAHEVTQLVLDGAQLDLGNFGDNIVSFEAPAGSHQLSIWAWCNYSHTGEGLHRFVDTVDEQTYLYSQFETADARRMYACFEQPDLKASFSLVVNAPRRWRVFSNSISPNPEMVAPQVEQHVFAPTPRISTYLTALVAGPYHVQTDVYKNTGGEIRLGLVCRESMAKYLDAERLFETTKAGLAVFEAAFDQPYPFAKYDQIFVPEFNFGAMENAGCITFRDEYLFRSKTTKASYEGRDNTVLHEMAHMWFGDLVTMRWWDDLWLNESFAEWASHWCQAKIGTGDDPWVVFANNRKNWAYRQDQLPSTHPIAADMVDLEAVELNFDGITYAKGASVLKQLVAYVGENEFLEGLRAYFAKYAWGNTTFDDLLDALSQASGRDLSSFAAQWLQTTGPNTLRAEFDVDATGCFTHFAIRQSGETLRQHRLAIGLYSSQADSDAITRIKRIETDISGELTQIPQLIGCQRPELILLNDDDLTYAKIRLDERSLSTVINHLSDIDSALARALCWGAAWDMCRDGELPASGYIELVLKAVPHETDLTGVGTVLAQAKKAIDYYCAREQRAELNSTFHQRMCELAKAAVVGSDHQLAFFRAAVYSAPDASAAFLQNILAGVETIPGLEIDTDLRWRIVTQLAGLGVFGQVEISAELERDNTNAGMEKAAGARATQPDAQAKEAAWSQAVSEQTPNETHAQVCSQFWRFDQDEVLMGYLDRYLEVAAAISDGRDGWDTRSSTIRQHILGVFFPAPLMNRVQLDRYTMWFNSHELSPSVTRQFAECLDDAERALRCQGAAASAV
ncbi:MAG: aminopeptidase N [Propionibacteriaceae bacterium]|nr:aminopeptidase N [Propionibacteriaceae bacterium]